MTHNHHLSMEHLLDQAYEIFLELAEDNLSPALLRRYQEQFDARGALGSAAPDDTWLSYSDIPLDSEQQVEITVGLVNDQDTFDTVFARLLLSRDPDDRSCYIRWNE